MKTDNTIETTKKAVEADELLRNSFMLSIIIYIGVIILLNINLALPLVIYLICMFSISIGVVYSSKSNSYINAFKGVFFCALFLIYTLFTKFMSIPIILAIALECVISLIAILYMFTLNDMHVILQLVLLVVPCNFTYTDATMNGILNVLSYILFSFAYQYICHNEKMRFSAAYLFCVGIPLFRNESIGLMIYTAITVAVHSYKLFSKSVELQDDPDLITTKPPTRKTPPAAPQIEETKPIEVVVQEPENFLYTSSHTEPVIASNNYYAPEPEVPVYIHSNIITEQPRSVTQTMPTIHEDRVHIGSNIAKWFN